MCRFIKENPALAAGIGLPFVLVAFFSLSTAVINRTVEPPKYDVLFTVQNSECVRGEAKVNFEAVAGKIEAHYNYPKKENNYFNCYNDNEKLYRFDAKNLMSKEITINVPSRNDESPLDKWQNLEIPELSGITIDAAASTPDGYRFETGDRYYRGDIFPFFSAYNYRSGAVLAKSGRTFKLIPDDGRYYYGNSIKYLGFAVPAEGK